jgi:tRNA(Ile)-lysidine synthase
VRAVVEYGVLRFARANAEAPQPAAGELGLPGAFEFGTWELRATLESAGPDAPARAAHSGEVGMFDADRLGARALTVRSWRAGDRMRPLGLAGSKSLADLFGARRVPREARAGVPVVIAGDEIVWVPGVATAERVRVDADTRALAVLHAVRR